MAENNGEKCETILSRMKENKNNWFLDSDCNNNMCGDKNMFTDLDESFRSFVKFDNNERVFVLGKGKIRITLKNERYDFISEVLYVPNLYHILLSFG